MDDLSDLIARAGAGDVAARNEVVVRFRGAAGRLPSRLARWGRGGVDRDDLEQEAVFGVIRAVETFDPAGVRTFEEHARRHAERAVRSGFRRKRFLVRVSEHSEKLWNRRRKGEALTPRQGRLADTFWAVWCVARDFEVESRGESHEEAVARRDEEAWALKRLESLGPGVRESIETRFGLNGKPTLTRGEAAKVVGVHRRTLVQWDGRVLRWMAGEGDHPKRTPGRPPVVLTGPGVRCPNGGCPGGGEVRSSGVYGLKKRRLLRCTACNRRFSETKLG